MQKYKCILLLLLVILIAACSPELPTLTPTAQATAMPPPTAAPVPLSEIDLEPLLIQGADLRVGYLGAQIRDYAPPMFDKLPGSENTIYQQLEYNGEQTGGVTVFLYSNENDLSQAYIQVLYAMGDQVEPVQEIGDEAALLFMSIEVLSEKKEYADLAFIRCGALAHIRIGKDSDKESIIAYAKRLDKRLEPIICR